MTDDPLRARSALFSLDAGCDRNTWLRIGMAAKAAGIDEQDWLDWSATGSNFASAHDAQSVWHSIHANGGIGAGTLFHMATSAGWRDDHSETRSNGARTDRALHRMNGICGSQLTDKGPVRDLSTTFGAYHPASANHPYIIAKRGDAAGLRVVPCDDPFEIHGHRVAGWLVVPVRDLDGALMTLQYLPPPGTGKKLNAPGGKFGAGLFVVGDIVAAGRVYVCEGIGQAWSCSRADREAAAVVAFGASRLRVVTQALRARYPSARLILLADRGKERDCETSAREVGGAWVRLPDSKPPNYDANDYEQDHGTDALKCLLNAAEMPRIRYRIQTAEELMSAPPLRYLIEQVVPNDGVAALYGPTGCGKSFLVLDMCIAIAAGAPDWFGRRVTAAPVTYCALEGERGIGKRLQAWAKHHRRPLPPTMRFVTQPLDLRNATDVDDLAKAVSPISAGGLVVIDTLNRAAPGADENSSSDMGILIESCQALRRRIGGAVMLVHHSGKDGARGMRGHSSLYAALDGAIEVARIDGKREWTIAKSKDGEDGARFRFALRVVEVDADDNGDAITSCVVEPDNDSSSRRAPLPQRGHQRIVLDVLAEPLRSARHFGRGDAPSTHPCIELSVAIGIAAARLPTDAKHRKQRAEEAITALVSKGIYGTKDGWLWRN